MVSERWEQVEHLFSALADLPPNDRVLLLERTCREDTELREEVESLLRADGKNGEGILTAIEHEAQSLFNLEGIEGSRIGAYRVIGEIGRGGMGTVYLAVRDDDQYRRNVAIKLIRRGMDTQDILDRFRYERQILANLDHPHIATLFDGGTAPDGRPFLVMEYVQGEPLDAYCDSHNLGLRERCHLFLKVCAAVSYAHRNLVVHRDLKPGNVLVTADASPKLLDFGIARLLENDGSSGRTAVASRLVTPDYASPEEIRGDKITTAADLYSLGAILYELLSGEHPHRFASYNPRELERVICEVDPPRASDVAIKWSKQIRGDLDAIILKALRKEPGMRYASVDQLAADLERYLKGWSVLARRGSMAYRARKFLRRNSAPLAAGALLAVALIGGATEAAVQARRANQERIRAEHERQHALESQARAEASQTEAESEAREADRERKSAELHRSKAEAARIAEEAERQIAEQRFEQLRQLAGKFLMDFHDSIAKLPGSTPARKMTVETGLRYYDTLVAGSRGNRQLLEEIARGYDRLGDVQGNPYYANLGDIPGAMASYRKALALREKILDPSPEFLRDRILGNVKIAQLMTFKGDLIGAEQVLKATIQLAQQGTAAAQYVVQEALANTYSAYGDLKIRAADNSQAIEPYSRLLEIWSSLSLDHRDPASERKGISLAHTKLGETYGRLLQGGPALEHMRIAVDIDKQLAAEDPNNLPRLRKLYIDYMVMGMIFRSDDGPRLGSPKEARTIMETAADLTDRMVAMDPTNTTALMDVMGPNTGLGDWLREHNDVPAALLRYRKALEAAEKYAALGPATLASNDAMIQAHQRLALGLLEAGQSGDALEHLRNADAYIDRAEKQSPGLLRLAVRRAEVASGRADAHRHAANWSEAIAAYKTAITLHEAIRSRDPKNEESIDELPKLSARLADCFAAGQQRDQAILAMRSALDRFAEIASRRTLRADEQQALMDGYAKITAWK